MGEDRQGRGAQEGRRPLTGRLEAVSHGDGGPAGHRRRFCRLTFPPKHTRPLRRPSPTARSRASFTSIRRGPTAAARSMRLPTPQPPRGLKFIVVTDHGDGTRAPDRPGLPRRRVVPGRRRDQHGRRTLRRARHAEGAVSARRRGTRCRRRREAARRVRDRRAPGFAQARAAAGASGRRRSTPSSSSTRTRAGGSRSRRRSRAARRCPTRFPRRAICSRIPFARPNPSPSLIQPTGSSTQWADVARRRRVVIMAGADAHAQIAVWRSSDPVGNASAAADSELRLVVPRDVGPRRPERALTGEAVADAGGRPARDSGRPPLHVGGRRRHAAGVRIYGHERLRDGARRRSNCRQPAVPSRCTCAATRRRSSRRRSGTARSSCPAITTNRSSASRRRAGQGCTGWRFAPRRQPCRGSRAIRSMCARPNRRRHRRAATAARQPAAAAARRAVEDRRWHVEHDPTSLAAVDLPRRPRQARTARAASQARLRFGSPSGRSRAGSTRRSSSIWRQDSRGTIAWRSRAAPSSPCGFPCSSDRIAGELAAVGLRRHGGSGAHGVFRRPDTGRAAPARTSRHAPRSATSCS